MRLVPRVLSALITCLPLMSFAQQPTPSHAPPNTPNIKRIAGTLARVDGNEILLRVKGGTTETYQLSPAVELLLSRPARMADLTPGRSVGCTSIYSDGATVLAGECYIFPAGTQGIARTPDATRGSSTPMISGTITEVRDRQGADPAKGRQLLVRIADREVATTVTVSSLTEITAVRGGDASALKPGAKLRGISEQAADGTAVIQSLTIL